METNINLREKRSLFATYKNTIESRRISTTLHVTQDGNSGVLVELVNNDLLDHLSGDWVSLAISGAFSNDDDVQSLTSRTFLNDASKKALKAVVSQVSMKEKSDS